VLAKILSSRLAPVAPPEDEEEAELFAPASPLSPPEAELPSPGRSVLGNPPPGVGKPTDGLDPPAGIPVDPACPLSPPWLPLELDWVPAAEPCELWLPAEVSPVWPDDCAPGIPAEDDAPLGSELEEDWPFEAEVWGAEPGMELGIPALGLLELEELPEPPEDEDDEEEEDEGEDGEPEDPPLDEGIPEDDELLLDEVAQPASASTPAVAARTAARCNCAATKVATRFMACTFGSVRCPLKSGINKQCPPVSDPNTFHRAFHPACRSSLGVAS
jgi:hypothetical protein